MSAQEPLQRETQPLLSSCLTPEHQLPTETFCQFLSFVLPQTCCWLSRFLSVVCVQWHRERAAPEFTWKGGGNCSQADQGLLVWPAASAELGCHTCPNEAEYPRKQTQAGTNSSGVKWRQTPGWNHLMFVFSGQEWSDMRDQTAQKRRWGSYYGLFKAKRCSSALLLPVISKRIRPFTYISNVNWSCICLHLFFKRHDDGANCTWEHGQKFWLVNVKSAHVKFLTETHLVGGSCSSASPPRSGAPLASRPPPPSLLPELW